MRFLALASMLAITSCAMNPHSHTERNPAQASVELVKEIKFDFNKDGIEDSVRIFDPKVDGVYFETVEISLSGKNGVKVLSNTKFASTGAIPGTSLELLENGSFKVVVDHSATRSVSVYQYTFSYRNGAFIYSGLTVDEYDRLDRNQGGSCDINLLTGKGMSQGKKVKVPVVKMKFEDLDEAYNLRACSF